MRITRTTTGILATAFIVLLSTVMPSESASIETNQVSQPIILFDLGHNNFGAGKVDQTFYGYLEEHGFTIKKLHSPIDDRVLGGIDVFHTSNALASVNVDNWSLPNPSAFTADEIEVLLEWVRRGGSLLMAIEHMPFGGSYDELSKAIGIEVSNGFAMDSAQLNDFSKKNIVNACSLVFSREDDGLSRHLIITGQNPYGPIKHLATSCGSAFNLPSHATPLITLGAGLVSLEPETSWVFNVHTPAKSVAGWSQAGIMKFGEGRIAILGDNFLVSAPGLLEPPYVESEQEAEIGAHNHKFTLNLYRWLSGQEDLLQLQ